MTRCPTRAARAAGLVSATVLVAGGAAAVVAAPASAMQAHDAGRSCFSPAAVGAAARSASGADRAGSDRGLDHRELTARQVRAIEARTADILDRRQDRGTTALATNPKSSIPVYVHEMRSASGAGDVSLPQIQAQIDVLNATYAGSDANEPAGVAAPDTGVRFYLADSNEYFNNSWHVDRQTSTYRSQTRQGGRNALNIWLVDFSYLGVATFPWDYARNPGVDGIRVQYNSLPRTSSPAAGYQAIAHYDLGETATHEAGHWLGLYHTFQGGCTSTNDEVADTPAQSSSTTGCPTGRDSCSLPGLDPIHNYMDYSYDNCYWEFSPGQVSRIDSMWTAYRA